MPPFHRRVEHGAHAVDFQIQKHSPVARQTIVASPAVALAVVGDLFNQSKVKQTLDGRVQSAGPHAKSAFG